MILDDNLVFTDDKTPATGASEPVALTSFHNPGKVSDLYIMLRVTAAITGATSIDVKLQQSDTKNGSYTDVPGFGITLSQDDGDFDAGAVKGYYALPPTLTKQWMKLDYTVTGSVTAGKLFAAITPFRDIPYESGEYIDAGKVVGVMQVRAKEPLAYRNVRYEAGEEFTFYGEEKDMTPAMEPVGSPMRKTKRANSEHSEVFPVPETEA